MLLSNPYGFYTSSDRGATWTKYPSALNGIVGATFTGDMVVAPNGDIYFYVPLVGALRVSHDGGASFTELTPYNKAPLFRQIRMASDGTLYGLDGIGLLRSADGGHTWQRRLFGQANDMALRGSTMAIGLTGALNGSASEPGGLYLSQNSGSEWISIGLKKGDNVQDFAFDQNGNLLILAHRGIFRRAASGWQTLGSNQSFVRIAATQGAMMIGAISSVFHSSDNGTTWKESSVEPPSYGGTDATLGMPVMLGRRNGGFIFSIAWIPYVSSVPVVSALYTTDATGTPKPATAPGGGLTGMVENVTGTLYAGTSFLNPITYQYEGEQFQSNDAGASWQKLAASTVAMPLAYNSRNSSIRTGGSTGLMFAPVDKSEANELKLNGFTSQANYIRGAQFDRDDRLWLLTSDKGLFSSQSALK
jgi:hypothetical protein